MKWVFGLFFLSLSVASFSQSFLIMDNGITITTDSSGGAYDFGHYAFPQKIKMRGGNYFVEEGGVLATIDHNGLLFRKYEVIPSDLIGKGNNYFLSQEGILTAIDKFGLPQKTENKAFKKATQFGGNFFIAENSKKEFEIFVVVPTGEVIKGEYESLNPKDVVDVGGNYFMTNKGELFTVNEDGIIALQDKFRIGIMVKKGGNYFIDSSGYFFTITQKGELLLPGLPVSLEIKEVQKMGSNYFINEQGVLFLVDKFGNVFEKEMPDFDFRFANIISH